MVTRPPVICSCGHELKRPIPRVCPHCKSEIVEIRKSGWPTWLPVLLVVLMFGTLLALVFILASIQ